MPDLTVLAANLHNEAAAVAYLRRRSRADAPGRVDVAFVSEAHRRRHALRRLPGHHYYTGPHRGPSQEVGILVDRRLPILGETSQFASAAIGGELARVGKERWGKDVVTDVQGVTTAFVTVHPVAGARLRTGALPPSHVLACRYADAMRWLDATITYHRALGHQVILGGDMQVVPDNTEPWSIYPLLGRHNLEWFRDGIDLIAWTNGYARVRGEVDHSFPSDHPAVKVELNINRTRLRKRNR